MQDTRGLQSVFSARAERRPSAARSKSLLERNWWQLYAISNQRRKDSESHTLEGALILPPLIPLPDSNLKSLPRHVFHGSVTR